MHFDSNNGRPMRALWAVAGGVALALTHAVVAASPIYGGPMYNPNTGDGYQNPSLPVAPGGSAGDGTAVVSARKYSGGTNLGIRAMRWDASSAAAVELGNLGTDSGGVTSSYAIAVNTAGTAVGVAQKYSGNTPLSFRAVRWDVSSAAAVELGNLGTDSNGSTYSMANAVNTAGTAVGYAHKYSGDKNLGFRAVRWDASSTAAVELGNLGTDSNGFTTSMAYAVNTAGSAVGYAQKFSGDTNLGFRAARWDASSTTAIELGNLGTDSGGVTNSYAYAVNTAGTAVGYAQKFSGDTNLGCRAARWDASSTAAVELGNLGTDSGGVTNGYAYAVNTAGTAVGYARKYSGDTSLGDRAVRWDASSTAAVELGNLGTNLVGFTYSVAQAVNAAGTAVGYANQYRGNMRIGLRAVAWDLDGIAIDLNTLLSPADALLWTLTEAHGISDTGWITGVGIFDPDGTAGPSQSYERAFLLQIPEPTGLSLLAFTAAALHRRRRG